MIDHDRREVTFQVEVCIPFERAGACLEAIETYPGDVIDAMAHGGGTEDLGVELVCIDSEESIVGELTIAAREEEPGMSNTPGPFGPHPPLTLAERYSPICRDCGTSCECCDDAYPEAGYCCECGPLHRDDPRMIAIGQGPRG